MFLSQKRSCLVTALLIAATLSATGFDQHFHIGNALAQEDSVKNLVVNGGFEDGDKTPAQWTEGAQIDGVQYVWDRKQGQAGSSSLSLKKSAQRYFPVAQWWQIIERKPGARQIRVSSQVKASKVTKATIDVIFLDDNSEWISHEWSSYIGAKEAKDAPVTHDWKEYSGTIKIPDNARKIQIGLQIYGPGQVWFDEVQAAYVE